MKLPFTLCLLLLLIHFQSSAQKLKKHERDSLKTVLNEMGIQDQKYRREIMYGTKKKEEIDSINKLPSQEIKNLIQTHTHNHQQEIDSLWVLQNKIDSINKGKLISIINKFGFPSPERINSKTTTYLLLHLTSDKDFTLLNPIFLQELKKGNMPAQTYAEWYDRILLNKGKHQLYGAYNTKHPCVLDIEKTNEERAKIGLKKLRKNKCM